MKQKHARGSKKHVVQKNVSTIHLDFDFRPVFVVFQIPQADTPVEGRGRDEVGGQRMEFDDLNLEDTTKWI